jgi:type IV pilus assembly protein PilA
MLRRPGDSKGFTLIELMIVVAIIGILAAIAIPNFVNFKNKAIQGTAKANLETVRSSLSQYAADKDDNKYPPEGVMGSFTAMVTTLKPYGCTFDASSNADSTKYKWTEGSWSYASDGTEYTVRVTATDSAGTTYYAYPSGVTGGT